MILYKYTRADIANRILETTRIRFTQLTGLNDPFESFPPVDRTYSNEEFWKLLRNILDSPDAVESLIAETIDTFYEKLPVEKQREIPRSLFAQVLLFRINSDLGKKGLTLREFMRQLGLSQKTSVIEQARHQLVSFVASNIGYLASQAYRTKRSCGPVKQTYIEALFLALTPPPRFSLRSFP